MLFSSLSILIDEELTDRENIITRVSLMQVIIKKKKRVSLMYKDSLDSRYYFLFTLKFD